MRVCGDEKKVVANGKRTNVGGKLRKRQT